MVLWQEVEEGREKYRQKQSHGEGLNGQQGFDKQDSW